MVGPGSPPRSRDAGASEGRRAGPVPRRDRLGLRGRLASAGCRPPPNSPHVPHPCAIIRWSIVPRSFFDIPISCLRCRRAKRTDDRPRRETKPLRPGAGAKRTQGWARWVESPDDTSPRETNPTHGAAGAKRTQDRVESGGGPRPWPRRETNRRSAGAGAKRTEARTRRGDPSTEIARRETNPRCRGAANTNPISGCLDVPDDAPGPARNEPKNGGSCGGVGHCSEGTRSIRPAGWCGELIDGGLCQSGSSSFESLRCEPRSRASGAMLWRSSRRSRHLPQRGGAR
jgi:hypothetical protein